MSAYNHNSGKWGKKKVKLTGCAVVNVRLTVVSAVSRLTYTGVAALAVDAAAAVFARGLFAFVHVLTAACAYIVASKRDQ